MSVPERTERYPTRDAIESLARRFGLPNHKDMQDWQWEVADPDRLGEFLDAYESAGLSDDERFTLMETIIQSAEESPGPLSENADWQRALVLLQAGIALHIDTIRYWAVPEAEDDTECWRVTPDMRRVLDEHRGRSA